MMSPWKSRARRGATWIFERTLCGVFTAFDQLYRAARVRRMWGQWADDNLIHPSAVCHNFDALTIRIGATIGAGCRIEMGETGRVTLERVHLESNVSLAANAGTLEIGFGTYINTGSWLWTAGGPLLIGRQVLIGPYCVVSAGNHGIRNLEQPIIEQPLTSLGISIGDNVWLGAGTVVCDGVHIGEGAIIGAGAVVTKNIPPFAVAGGVPCRVLRWRDADRPFSPAAAQQGPKDDSQNPINDGTVLKNL